MSAFWRGRKPTISVISTGELRPRISSEPRLPGMKRAPACPSVSSVVTTLAPSFLVCSSRRDATFTVSPMMVVSTPAPVLTRTTTTSPVCTPMPTAKSGSRRSGKRRVSQVLKRCATMT